MSGGGEIAVGLRIFAILLLKNVAKSSAENLAFTRLSSLNNMRMGKVRVDCGTLHLRTMFFRCLAHSRCGVVEPFVHGHQQAFLLIGADNDVDAESQIRVVDGTVQCSV